MEHIQLNCELLSLTITETSHFLSALFFLFFMQYFFKKPQCRLRHMKGKSWFCFLVRVCSSVDRVWTPVRPRWDLDPPQPVSILQVIRNQFQKSGPSPLFSQECVPSGEWRRTRGLTAHGREHHVVLGQIQRPGTVCGGRRTFLDHLPDCPRVVNQHMTT